MSWSDTLLKVELSLLPMPRIAPIAATAMRAAIRPYSMAVAPSLSFIILALEPDHRCSSFWSIGLAGVFIAGGFIGSFIGTRAAKRLSSSGQLTTIFAVLIFVVAAYMLWKSAGAAF